MNIQRIPKATVNPCKLTVTFSMRKLFLIIWLLFSSSERFAFASTELRNKPSNINRIKRRILSRKIGSKVYAFNEEISGGNLNFEEEEEASVATVQPSYSATFINSKTDLNYFNLLPEVLNQKIFEYVFEDYAAIRSVSKDFLKIYDDFIYRIAWENFPRASLSTFSQFREHNTLIGTLQYRLIPFAHILYYNMKPFVPFYAHPLQEESGVQSTTILDVRFMNIIKALRIYNLTECLKMTSALLKLQLVKWDDVFPTLFLGNFNTILAAWSLGLTTIASLMSLYTPSAYLYSIESDNEGILLALRGRHYKLSHFILVIMRGFSYQAMDVDRQYLDDIIEELIRAQYWDLLLEVYEMFPRHNYSHHLFIIVKNGSTKALKVFRNLVIARPEKIGYMAASFGHLEFLKELDNLGLLQDSYINAVTGDTAFHSAAFFGRTECLEFLINRLGYQHLGVKDKFNFMPIHLASQRNNPETLRTIIKFYPHYSHRFLGFVIFKFVSPLNLAVTNNALDSAIILLESFPELLYYTDENRETVIHVALRTSSKEMLEMLLNFAPPEIVSARNLHGNSALHLAAEISNISKISILLNAGHFTGMERNNAGLTPVSIFHRLNPLFTLNSVMQIFSIDNTEQLYEALRYKRRNVFNYLQN